MSRRPGSRARYLLAGAAAVLLVGASGTLAWFSSTGAGTSPASIGVLTAPTITAATPSAGAVSLTWSAVSPPAAGTVTYSVSRDAGSPGGNCPTSSSPTTVTACTDAGLTAGTYHYTVTAHWATWTATSSIRTVTVAYGALDHLAVSAATTTPTAGSPDALTITAKDAQNITVASYTGDHSLTFGGANTAPDGWDNPTVTSKTGAGVAFGSPAAITFTGGVATAGGVMTLYRAETASVTVTDGSISNGGGLSVTVGAATAASLTLAAATSTPTAGVADNLTLTAKDQYLNVATGYVGDHALTFGGAHLAADGTHGPTVTGKTGSAIAFGSGTTISFTTGVASVSGSSNGVMTLYKVETVSITVSDGSITNGAGLPVTVGPAGPASFLLGAASTTPTAGQADNLTITARDAYLNTATGYTGDHNLTFGGANTAPDGTHTPTVSSKTGSATAFGVWTLVTFTGGVASVSGSNNGVMTLYRAETVSITVTDGSISNGTGLSVTVGPAGQASLLLGAASTTPTAGQTDNLTITARDAYLNTATGYTGAHNLTFGGANTAPDGTHVPTVSDAGGTARTLGTATSITFTAGVASVSGSSNGVMTLYRVETVSVTVSDGSITNGAGLLVTVSGATATTLSLSASTTTPTAGAADNLTITAKDVYLNPATGYSGSHNLTFGGANTAPDGTHAPTVSTSGGTATAFGVWTAISFTSGVATVSGASNGVMRLYKAETVSITVTDGSITNGAGLSVTVSPASAASFLLQAASTTPTAGATDNLTITARDAYLNTATAYTGSHNLTFSGAGTAPDGTHAPTVSSSTGVAVAFGSATAITFTSGVATTSGANNGVMTLYRAEATTITLTDGSVSTGTGLGVTVSAASAARLGFTQQPGGATGGTAFTSQPVVAVQDQFQNTVTGDASSVTLAIGTNPGPGTLSCTTNPKAASGGVSTFAGCKIDKAAGGYTLTATDGALASATSSSFNVTVGPAAQLAFTTQPAGAQSGFAFTTQPQVSVEDAGGNVVTTDTSNVTLAILNNPNSGTLTCTANPRAASGGVATFSGCSIDKVAAGYTLRATDGSLTSATSAGFNVPIAYLGKGSTDITTNSSPMLPSLPSGLVPGDLMLAISVNTKFQAPASSPSGWTPVLALASMPGSSTNPGVCLSVWYRVYQAGDGAPSVPVSTDAGGASARVIAYRGASTPLDVTPTTAAAGGTTTFSAPGLTTATAMDRAVSIVAENGGGSTAPTLNFSNAQSFTAGAGFPEQVTAVGQDHAVDDAGLNVVSPSPVTFPSYSSTLSGAWAAISLALRPS